MSTEVANLGDVYRRGSSRSPLLRLSPSAPGWHCKGDKQLPPVDGQPDSVLLLGYSAGFILLKMNFDYIFLKNRTE